LKINLAPEAKKRLDSILGKASAPAVMLDPSPRAKAAEDKEPNGPKDPKTEPESK